MIGEHRHERCRYGTLTQAWRVEHGVEKPCSLPLCTFPTPDPCPPAMERVWGGLVEVDRDCAGCKAFAEVQA